MPGLNLFAYAHYKTIYFTVLDDRVIEKPNTEIFHWLFIAASNPKATFTLSYPSIHTSTHQPDFLN